MRQLLLGSSSVRRGPHAITAPDMLFFEKRAGRRGFRSVAGIDEAGRGPLAGPVVAAAVILPPGVVLPEVNDSKKLTSAQRESCYEAILACACGVGVGQADASDIDRMNILQATFAAMVQAVEQLETIPDHLLIDGPYRLPLAISQEGIPGGDGRSLSVAAASIVAKVRRDRIMRDYDVLYPSYGFKSHKGYGTARHLEALRVHGPCPIHRRSFRGVL